MGLHTDIRKLKSRLVENGRTQEQLAQHLHISEGTVSRKITGGGIDFSVGQIHKIAEWLGLTGAEVADIFFAS